MSPALLGFVRAVLVAAVMGVVVYLSNAANLHGIVPDGLATLIAAVALSVEHALSAGSNTALFGSVYKK